MVSPGEEQSLPIAYAVSSCKLSATYMPDFMHPCMSLALTVRTAVTAVLTPLRVTLSVMAHCIGAASPRVLMPRTGAGVGSGLGSGLTVSGPVGTLALGVPVTLRFGRPGHWMLHVTVHLDGGAQPVPVRPRGMASPALTVNAGPPAMPTSNDKGGPWEDSARSKGDCNGLMVSSGGCAIGGVQQSIVHQRLMPLKGVRYFVVAGHVANQLIIQELWRVNFSDVEAWPRPMSAMLRTEGHLQQRTNCAARAAPAWLAGAHFASGADGTVAVVATATVVGGVTGRCMCVFVCVYVCVWVCACVCKQWYEVMTPQGSKWRCRQTACTEAHGSHVVQSAPLQPGLQVHTLPVASMVQLPLSPQPPLLGASHAAARVSRCALWVCVIERGCSITSSQASRQQVAMQVDSMH